MRIAALCATYGRPSLVENSLALFLRQRLRPGIDSAVFLVLDDAGQIAPQSGVRGPLAWEVASTTARFESLPAKYSRLVEIADEHYADAVSVWDDDDVYLAGHLAAHAETLERQGRGWSHPSSILSTYGRESIADPPRIEPTGGRFHGALAVGRELLREVGGWVQTHRATFDQEMIAKLEKHAGPAGDPCELGGPTYVYRWGDTERWHCSGVMDKTDWYARTPIEEPGLCGRLLPRFDGSTQGILHLTQDGESGTRSGPAIG
jgi:hypothetical protein